MQQESKIKHSSSEFVQDPSKIINNKRSFWIPFFLGGLFVSVLFVVYLSLVQPLLLIPTSFEKTKTNLPALSGYNQTKASLKITIGEDGIYYVDGKEVDDKTPESLFRALVQALKERNELIPPLIISADRNVDFQSVVTAMDIAGRLGLTNFSIETLENER